MSVIRRLLRTGALTVAWLVLVPCALLPLVAILPMLPWVRIYAFDIVPNWASWLLIGCLAVLAIGLFARRQPGGAAGWLIAAALIGVLANAIVIGRLWQLAASHGARIDLVATLSLRDYSEAAAPDATYVYDMPDGEPLSLDVYRPPAAMRFARPGPVLVMIHGGGFVGGTRRLAAANMRNYAGRGWTVVSVDYRLARPGRPTWNLAADDVRCAMAWVAAHAGALHVDTSRLALNGASAGGNLALAAAYTRKAPRPGCGPALPPVAAVVARVPLVDPAASWDHGGEMQQVQRRLMRAYFGGSPAEVPARYRRRDVRRRLTPGLPPTLIMAAANDPILPIASARDLAARSAALGNRITLVVFPYAGHDFNAAYEGIPNQTVRQIVTRFLAENDPGPAR